MERVKSPITYMGNKFRLIDTIIDCIPWKINHFYDLFGGSGTVSLNATSISNVVHYNELNNNIYGMFKSLVDNEDIIGHITKREKEFNLQKLTKYEESNAELGKEYKKRFDNFRAFVNNSNPLDYKDIYTLMNYSFNGLIRFSQENNFNAPFGYTERDGSALKSWINKTQKIAQNIKITNESFENVIKWDDLGDNDFVYVDPPYMNTTAVYNENRLTGWNMENEENLFKLLEALNRRGIKWAMSNIFGNSKVVNQHLINWCEKNSWYVKHLNIKYATFGQKDKINDEVLITNYDPKQYIKQIEFDLF